MPRKGGQRDEGVCVTSKTKYTQRGKSLTQNATAWSWLLPECMSCGAPQKWGSRSGVSNPGRGQVKEMLGSRGGEIHSGTEKPPKALSREEHGHYALETSLWQHRRGERSGDKHEEEKDSKELISKAGIESGEAPFTPIADHQVWKPQASPFKHSVQPTNPLQKIYCVKCT